MKASLRSLSSFDVEDLATWRPKASSWSIGIRIVAGPDEGPGDESFDLTICSVEWVEENVAKHGAFEGRHHLIVGGFQWSSIEAYVTRRVTACSGSTWDEVAQQLGRFAYWEFEDYAE